MAFRGGFDIIANPIAATAANAPSSTGYLMHWGDTPDMALGTSVLYLIPGVPLINAIMDIIDEMMNIAR